MTVICDLCTGEHLTVQCERARASLIDLGFVPGRPPTPSRRLACRSEVVAHRNPFDERRRRAALAAIEERLKRLPDVIAAESERSWRKRRRTIYGTPLDAPRVARSSGVGWWRPIGPDGRFRPLSSVEPGAQQPLGLDAEG